MLDFLAEQRLQEAVSRGELDNLPGAGRPLELDDAPLVPEELRLAYRILKNAGLVPPEVEQLSEIGQLESLVHAGETDASVRAKAVRKLALLKTRIEAGYYQQAVAKLGR
jgi:hypothetical protein